MKQIGPLHKIDEMLQEGSLTQVKDILNHAEKDFEKARDNVDACISSAYPDLVNIISTFCNVQNASNNVFHLFDSIKISQQKIREALIHSTQSNICFLPNGLTMDYRYENMSGFPPYAYHDIYSWLFLNEEWTCFLDNILQGTKINQSNDTSLTKKEHSMLLQFFFDIPRRITHLLLFYHSLPAFFLLVFLIPKLFQRLESSQQWRHEQEYHQFKTRHQLFCYSKNFKKLFRATVYKSFQKLYPLRTFHDSYQSIKQSFNCFICSCSICQHFLKQFSHFSTLRDFENLFVLSLCDNLPKEQCLSIFITYRQNLLNQLIQTLQEPQTFPSATNTCQLLALCQNINTPKKQSIPSSCEIQLVFMAYCIAAIISLIETSTASSNFFMQKEPSHIFNIFYNFVYKDMQDTVNNSQVDILNKKCSCMFCKANESPIYWHIWVDGTHLPKQAECQAKYSSPTTWKVFEKNTSHLIQAFNTVMFSLVCKDHDQYNECFDIYRLELMISFLVIYSKASDIQEYMVHPFFERLHAKKQEFFFYNHLNSKSLSQKQTLIQNHWNSLFLSFNDSSQDTFFNCFIHQWNQCVSEKIQQNVCVKLKSIFSKKNMKSNNTLDNITILNQMNEFLHLELSKAQNYSSVSFFHKICKSNPIQKTFNKNYNLIKCESVVSGLVDFIEKEILLLPYTEWDEKSNRITSKTFLSNNLFVLLLLLLTLKSENTQESLKNTYHGFETIALLLKSQSFSTGLYKKFQKCESTVFQACQNLFEMYWYQVLQYDSQCFCECLYENVVNCQTMMVHKDERNLENDIILPEQKILNKENFSITPQNQATNDFEKTECIGQMLNPLTQKFEDDHGSLKDAMIVPQYLPETKQNPSLYDLEKEQSIKVIEESHSYNEQYGTIENKKDIHTNSDSIDLLQEQKLNTSSIQHASQLTEVSSSFLTKRKNIDVLGDTREKSLSPNEEVLYQDTTGNDNNPTSCGNGFFNEIDLDKMAPQNKNDVWFPQKISDALFTLLFTANHQLSMLYAEAHVLLNTTFLHSIMECFQEKIRTSLLQFLDKLALDMYLRLWTEKDLFDFPQHLLLNAVTQCLFDIRTIQLLHPVNKECKLSAAEKYLREEYLEDIIDQIIFTESKITNAAQCFLDTCRFLLVPLLVCHNTQRGFVPIKVYHEGMLYRVNDLCELKEKKIQLIEDACLTNEPVCDEKEKKNHKDDSVKPPLETFSKIQPKYTFLSSKKMDAKSDKAPYLNVSSFSSFLRGQVEELSSKVSEVMKQRSSNNNP